MEVRISKMEKEVALIAQALGSLDKNLQESFARVHKRMDKRDATETWGIRLVVGALIIGSIGYVIKGGLVV